MSRFSTFLAAIVLALTSLAAGLPAGSMLASHTASHIVHRSIGLGRDTLREDDRMERRDFTWTNSKSPQNLCGDSSFTTSDDDAGPSVSDCQTFLDWVSDREGFWLVTGFSSGGDSWEEFARVESCAIAVRHADSATGTIPIGNQDVSDIMKSVISQYGGAAKLPSVHGTMDCKRDPSSASVEWKVYKS
ncbi:glycoside hydrolase family 18 protein [Diaporthe amygdali]|uniref:glycoside hydrolase family 18 protein n=1 Tax=Phomopsis amygdali TaxID=1214568 RepID=UPI0022FEBE47|nr:glycoside hydrolase family 18 protein [Diaporthe amygdali]KAJ0108590.1 glycoside hydrolase family 18 protein [Diaporthe amygdali]